MHTHSHIDIHIDIQVEIHVIWHNTHTFTNTYVHIRICIDSFIFIYTIIHAQSHTHICIFMYYTFTYTNTYMHKYAYTYIIVLDRCSADRTKVKLHHFCHGCHNHSLEVTILTMDPQHTAMEQAALKLLFPKNYALFDQRSMISSLFPWFWMGVTLLMISNRLRDRHDVPRCMIGCLFSLHQSQPLRSCHAGIAWPILLERTELVSTC